MGLRSVLSTFALTAVLASAGAEAVPTPMGRGLRQLRGPSATATPAPAATPSFLSRLEARRGSPLSAADKARLADAADDVARSAAAAQDDFAAALTAATGLSRADVAAMLPAPAPGRARVDTADQLVTGLGAARRRPLSAAETAAVRRADTIRRAALAPARARFAHSAGAIAGLAPPEVTAALDDTATTPAAPAPRD